MIAFEDRILSCFLCVSVSLWLVACLFAKFTFSSSGTISFKLPDRKPSRSRVMNANPRRRNSRASSPRRGSVANAATSPSGTSTRAKSPS